MHARRNNSTLVIAALAVVTIISSSSCRRGRVVCECRNLIAPAQHNTLLKKHITYEDASAKCVEFQAGNNDDKLKWDTCYVKDIR